MQTFLPYESYVQSAEALDNKRLGKQRVEAKQILIALGVPVGNHPGNPESRWRSHPAVKMWRGQELALCRYASVIAYEWRRRGFADQLYEQFNRTSSWLLTIGQRDAPPEWSNYILRKVVDSHRSNLLRKKPEFYRKFGWQVPDNLPYYWPHGLERGVIDGSGALRLYALWQEHLAGQG